MKNSNNLHKIFSLILLLLFSYGCESTTKTFAKKTETPTRTKTETPTPTPKSGEVRGTVYRGATAVGGALLYLQSSSDGYDFSTPVATTTSTSSGSFIFNNVLPSQTTSPYRIMFSGANPGELIFWASYGFSISHNEQKNLTAFEVQDVQLGTPNNPGVHQGTSNIVFSWQGRPGRYTERYMVNIFDPVTGNYWVGPPVFWSNNCSYILPILPNLLSQNIVYRWNVYIDDPAYGWGLCANYNLVMF